MEISLAGSPSCLAELRRAIRSSLAEVPAAIPSDVVDDVVLAVGEAAANAILYGSGDAQPVTVTVRVGGGWIEATIRDRGRPAAPRTAPVTGLRGQGLCTNAHPGMSQAVRPDERYAATVRELAAELDGGPLSSHLAWLSFAERMEAIAQQFTVDPSEVLAAVVDAPALLAR